jgi:hypothetical protein
LQKVATSAKDPATSIHKTKPIVNLTEVPFKVAACSALSKGLNYAVIQRL